MFLPGDLYVPVILAYTEYAGCALTASIPVKFGAAVAAGTSPHQQGRQPASTASDWSDVLNTLSHRKCISRCRPL